MSWNFHRPQADWVSRAFSEICQVRLWPTLKVPSVVESCSKSFSKAPPTAPSTVRRTLSLVQDAVADAGQGGPEGVELLESVLLVAQLHEGKGPGRRACTRPGP